jgi:catechol 2,3-dioxygenase-like lactoylglutathione lyase family enzyme
VFRSFAAAALGVAAIFGAPACGQSGPEAIQASEPFVTGPYVTEPFIAETGRGWQEALVSVRDLAPIRDFMVDIAGYEVMETGALDPAWLAAWDLPDGAGGEYALLRSPGKSVGWVRLVRFDGVEQVLIRPGAQAWDQGGLFSLMVRSEEAADVADAAHARGWSVFNQPQVFQFGPLSIKNVVVRLPDGVNLAVYSRVSPPVEGWDDLAGFSYPFNTMAMVHDIEAERAFLEAGLGFAPFWAGDYIDTQEVDTNFAMPNNLSVEIPRRTAILQQREGEDGRIELMQFVGLTGEDFSNRALPPNLGILGVRIPVEDLGAVLERLDSQGVSPAAGPQTRILSPYGEITWAAVRSPSGILIELYEQSSP